MSPDGEVVAADKVVRLLIDGLKDPSGRVHAEDLISAAAAIVGECCIEAAGDFDARRHEFTPGAHVFSDAINDLLCGNVSTFDDLPPASVFGVLRDRLFAGGYSASDFPDIERVFASFAAAIGKPEDWGWVPLSVPDENRPFLMPLRAAYEMRAAVDRVLAPFRNQPAQRLAITVQALAQGLIAVREAIQPRVALLLAFETVNGMAKTAPMTAEAFTRVAQETVAVPAKPRKPWWKLW